jgi:chromosome segregation protein
VFVERLTVSGFKSFYDRIELKLGPGITAVVGPNGCGKSNIADAFRWVLGEQSTKQLRGEAMEDVIFSGTRDRKPLGMAEVSLTVANNRGVLSTEWAEVTVGRKLFRSGESEYSLNRTSCRLRDIRDLFLDTGMGSHGYSVIEREMVDNILSDTTGHRRFLFEEAAGIMKYKVRKKEAIRKLEGTEADLLRLGDIISEVEKEVRSLGRQVGKARRHRRLLEEIRALDLSLSFERWRSLHDLRGDLLSQLASVNDAHAALAAQVAGTESEVEERRRLLLEKGREVSAAQAELDRVTAELASVDNTVSVLRERIAGLETRCRSAAGEAARHAERRSGAEAEAARLVEELSSRRADLSALGERLAAEEAGLRRADDALRLARDEVAARRETLMRCEREEAQVRAARERFDARIEDAARRLTRTEDEERELGGRRDGLAARRARQQGAIRDLVEEGAVLTAKQAAARERVAEEERTLEKALREQHEMREKVASLRSRFDLLEELRTRYEGYAEGVRAVMLGHVAGPGVVGVLADLISVPTDLIAAAGASLGDAVQTVVVSTTDAAHRYLDGLAERALGPVTFCPLDGVSGTTPRIGDGPRLVDRIGAEPQLRPLLESLFGHVVLASDRADAIARVRSGAASSAVTPSGELYTARGTVTGGGSSGRGGELLSRREEARTVAVDLRGAEEGLAAVEARRAALDASVRASGEALETARSRVEECDRRRQEEERVLGQLDFEDKLCREEIESVTTEAREAAEDLQGLRGERDGVASQEAERAGLRAAAEAALAENEAEEERLEAERDGHSSEVGDLRVMHATLSGEVRDLVARAERAGREQVEAAEAIRRKSEEERDERERIRLAQEEIRSLAAGLEALHRDRSIREERRRVLQEAYALEEKDIEDVERGLKSVRADLAARVEEAHGKEIRATEARADLENLTARIREEYGIRFDADFVPPEPPRVPPPAEASEAEEETPLALAREERLRWLRDKLSGLGPVNLLAIEDFEQKKERLEFLTRQRDDLLRAKDALLEAIQKINRTARAMFQDTFGVIQANFTKTFSTLFEGGTAEIVLTGEDSLEADIEIVARPRGKKLESMRLMSSGERALTAIALLFAIYLVKPSPFCILDEVDAPLDDANVERFVRMLREFSRQTQFIVITHNKKTMEAADCLYGVTMQEPGVSRVVSVRLDGHGNGGPPKDIAETVGATI